jgi:hypothetical protein
MVTRRDGARVRQLPRRGQRDRGRDVATGATRVVYRDDAVSFIGRYKGQKPDWPEPNRLLVTAHSAHEVWSWSRIRMRLMEIDPTKTHSGRVLHEWTEVIHSVASAGDRIVVERASYQSDVFVGRLSPDGRRWLAPLARLTNNDTDDRLGSWTADGSIAFTSDRDGSIDLFVQKPGEADAKVVARGTTSTVYPSVSRVGVDLLYTQYTPQDGGNAACKRYRLARSGSVEELDTALDCGAKIRCGARGAPCVVETISTPAEDAGAIHSLARIDPITLAVGPTIFEFQAQSIWAAWALSTDGTRIAYSDVSKIAVRRTDDARETPIPFAADEPPFVQFFDFAPDGTNLVFTSGMKGVFTLKGVDPAGQTWTLSTPDALAWFYGVAVATDGSIAVGGVMSDSDLWMLTPQ